MLMLLLACHMDDRVVCDEEHRELADDESIGDLDVTPASLLAIMGPPGAFSGAWPDGEPVSGTSTVVRASGPAMGVDGTERRVSHWELGWAIETMLDTVVCNDVLTVPVTMSVSTDDGAVDLEVPGIASADDHAGLQNGLPEFFFAAATFAYADADQIPAPLASTDAGGLELQYTPSQFDFVSLWWNGDDYTQIFQAPAE